jgi:histidinol dehydrogenase
MGVLKVREYAQMTSADRAQLQGRGRDAIFAPALQTSIASIIEDVRVNGDDAVCRALRNFDGISLEPPQLRVSADEFAQARRALDDSVVNAIRDMIDHIRRFNEQVMERKAQDWWFESEPGLFVGEKTSPIASAGLFCPSGKASYPSVMAQIGVPAVVAGVGRIVVITPPVPGSTFGAVDPATLVVADELGLRDVFRVNGPAGVAAVAFGTESIPRVVKVVGPGSPAVTCAQVEVQRYGCSTMMLLGPSESLILADDTADPVLLAADLLNEAEHGTDSTVLLITTSRALINATEAELVRQIAVLPAARREAALSSLGVNGGAIVVDSIEAGAELANQFGPEHMQIVTADDDAVFALVHCAGEVLLGQHTSIASANFVIGCPASLPTSGFANVSSGITAEAFLKRTAVAQANEVAMRRMAPSVIALADHEGFPAHANAERIRIGTYNPGVSGVSGG